jgi:outer membrane protein assembly factor BamB
MLMSRRRTRQAGAIGLLLAAAGLATAADRPQWGQQYSRNMVSDETNLPGAFDPATGKNVKWAVKLGGNTYASPIVAGGRVFVGTNNESPRDPRHKGDRGVLMCLDEETGKLAWQLVVPKVPGHPLIDWPRSGICSEPTVEGERVYVVTNRAEVVCLDVHGLTNGNDGPFRDEARLLAPPGKESIELGALDADILWAFDMPKEVGMNRHDAAHSSPLLHGRYLYVNTANGLDVKHTHVPAPEAPSLIVLDKTTGRLVAQDGERIGPRIFHCSWSSPSLGRVGGRALVFFGGGDGVCYAFEALQGDPPDRKPARLRKVWSFDCDPNAPKENVHQYIRNSRVSPSNIFAMPVYVDGRVYVVATGDLWWGKHTAWIKCVDATKTGDVTRSAELWSFEMRKACSTPSVSGGLVFVADTRGNVHCLDDKTGKCHWTHRLRGQIYASTLVADGKVYIGATSASFCILAARSEKAVLHEARLDGAIWSTATAANGVIYVAAARRLYALSTSPQ